MAISTTSSLAMDVCSLYANAVDEGTTKSAGYIVIYSGSVPASADTALGAQTALVTIPLANPAFGTVTNDAVNRRAEAPANAIADTVAVAAGTASFYRQFNRDDEVVWQGTVRDLAGSGDLKLSTTEITNGKDMIVSSYTFRIPY